MFEFRDEDDESRVREGRADVVGEDFPSVAAAAEVAEGLAEADAVDDPRLKSIVVLFCAVALADAFVTKLSGGHAAVARLAGLLYAVPVYELYALHLRRASDPKETAKS